MTVQKLKVRIFSRDAKENYNWLLNVLKSAMFESLVGNAVGTYITNNFRSFTDDLTQCTFAILYHTKKRGRLNITDVTDSLYDEELRDLEDHLGKNVIVLLDDLDDSSDGNMRRILQEQPLIKECAETLILISELEKQAANLTGSDPKMSPAPTSQTMQDAYDSIKTKIKRIWSVMDEAAGVGPVPRPRKVSSSGSDTQSEGYKSSRTTKSGYGQQGLDLDDVRSSSAYSSERSNRPLINTRLDQRDGIPAIGEETRIPFPEDDDQMPDKKQKTPSRRMVFFIIGGVVGLLLIILIIILCVTL
ncbi:uncharacterized protein LOC120942944 isoform X2 [Rana temporaria]|uniref:uncharacterized protein LOC120942944 isoform X2 n=1 Tax=Rana temporaria TaxID=8407 RepID=UPI001AACBA98|nr:uncharacterized protein LOC120942944 isoform X2 [Rana temporaria]